jgi:hypothetical protein
VPGEKPFNIRTDLTREDDGQYTFRFQPLATDNITNEVNEIVPRVAVGAEGDENYSPAPRTNVGLSIEVNDGGGRLVGGRHEAISPFDN